MTRKTFNLSLPADLLEKIDRQAKREFSSRSDYVRKAVYNQLQTEEAVAAVLDRANSKGKTLGIASEQQVYDIIADDK